MPAFRSCFVKVSQHSNDLLMILWGRKWSPYSIPPPSCLSFLGLLDIVCPPLPEGSDYYLIVIPHNFPEKSIRKLGDGPRSCTSVKNACQYPQIYYTLTLIAINQLFYGTEDCHLVYDINKQDRLDRLHAGSPFRKRI